MGLAGTGVAVGVTAKPVAVGVAVWELAYAWGGGGRCGPRRVGIVIAAVGVWV